MTDEELRAGFEEAWGGACAASPSVCADENGVGFQLDSYPAICKMCGKRVFDLESERRNRSFYTPEERAERAKNPPKIVFGGYKAVLLEKDGSFTVDIAGIKHATPAEQKAYEVPLRATDSDGLKGEIKTSVPPLFNLTIEWFPFVNQGKKK